MGFRLVFLSALFVVDTYGASQGDLITYLPGLSKLPNFKQYSGYLQASSTKHFFYWFAESQRDPANNPVVLWLNGGPGCSSLDGFLSENGPLHVSNDGDSLYMNPYSWNKLANVIYLESPAGVGFSYDDNDDIQTDDDKVAKLNYNALLDFFKKFPEYKNNPFFVTGESYGGVYVPTLSELIVDGGELNFQGFAVGNGLSNVKMNDQSLVYFAYYHGLFGDVMWSQILGSCCKGGFTKENCSLHDPLNSACSDLISQVYNIVYHSGLNEYALYLDCAGSSQRETAYKFSMGNLFRNLDSKFREELLSKKITVGTPNSGFGETPPCINSTALVTWLNKAEVRRALHIPSSVKKWDICSEQVSMGYKRIYMDVSNQYKKILSHPELRVLVYNGDTDMACNFLGDQWFVSSLNLPQVKGRAPWSVLNQVAGFAVEYKQLTFTTIRGSGHMVPQWAPSYAYEMFRKFIMNEPFLN